MRPKWWPDPPYIEISRAMAWDKGCNAMAKALIERIEADALRDYEVKKGYLLVLPSGYWTDLKRECGIADDPEQS